MQRSRINTAAIFAMAVGCAATSSSTSIEERPPLRGGRGAARSQNDRNLLTCSDDEKVFRLDLTTDDSGSDTSYIIEQYQKGSWKKYIQEKKHEANTRYNRRVCVAPGDYRLTMSDAGEACYTAYLAGNELEDVSGCGDAEEAHFALGESELENNLIEESSPSPPAQSPPDIPNPTEFTGRIGSCPSGEYLVSIEFQLDYYGGETTWSLEDSEGTTLLRNIDYSPFQNDIRYICLPAAPKYALIVKDPYDGICCEDESCSKWHNERSCYGYYKMTVNGNKVLDGGKYIKNSKTHVFNLEPHTMTERDAEWLESHNTRRKNWHKDYGKDYVPLKWSNSLKASSQIWATQLLKTCSTKLYHDPSNNKYGENLASNYGTGSWAAMSSTEDIVGRFVEREADWPWPDNAHLTQVIWRDTEHVGCTDASKILSNGQTCHVQVCRYARAGNCDMQSFNDGSDKWWMDAVMQDEPSKCGEECPPEGCHYY